MQSTWGSSAGTAEFGRTQQRHNIRNVDDGQSQGHTGRGSLGLFIERSTSAPPPSSTAAEPVMRKYSPANGDSLVGSDLLEHMTRGVDSNSATPLSGNRSGRTERSEDFESAAAADFLSHVDNSGRATAPITSSAYLQSGLLSMGALSRPLSATGSSTTASLGQPSFGETAVNHQSGDIDGLVRSHSAAPTLPGRQAIPPPPGLSNVNTSPSGAQSAVSMLVGGRRPASTSVIGNSQHATLRPAAKTLMELIQENPENNSSNTLPAQTNGSSAYSGQHAGITTASSLVDRRSESPSVSQQPRYAVTNSGKATVTTTPQPHYHQNEQDVRSAPPQTPTTVTAQTTMEALAFQHEKEQQAHKETHHQHQHQQHHQQQQQQQRQGLAEHAYAQPAPYSQQLQPQPQHHQLQQPHSQQPMPLQPHLQQQPPQLHQQLSPHQQHQQQQHPQQHQQQHQHHQHQQPVMRYVTVVNDPSASPGEEAGQQPTASIYAPVPAPHQAMHPHLSAPPPPHQQTMMDAQQLYYGGQQRVEIQPQSLQAQVLPSGQTVYVNTSPPPPSPYGYATVQYHHPHQPQIIHHHPPMPGGHGEQQYVSVLPFQGGAPPQLTYWQPEHVTAQGQAMATPATVTIVNAPGPGGATTPIAVTRLGNVPTAATAASCMESSSHQGGSYGRQRDKGVRGRRGGGGVNGRRGVTDAKHSTGSVSSQLLEEFRSSKNRDWTMHDVEGHVVEFCQDQNGSRFIQQRLEMGDLMEQQIVMNEVLPAIRRLRNDVFGNYVVQKLLDFGKPRMKADIRETLEGEMLQLSLQMYGCRVVQKALEALDENDLPRLLTEFHHNVLSCIHDQNGNHVIQKCIEVMSSRAKKAMAGGDTMRANFLNEQIDFIVDDVLVNAATLSCHPYGCRVLQRILEHCEEERKTNVLDQVRKSHRKLLDDQYGNYVIQHVLQFGRQGDRDSILEIVVESGLLSLSRQKFASNVVEKLLKYGNGSQTRAIVREMLKPADSGPNSPGDSGTSVVLLMVRDAYANYVVQTTLDVVPECEEKRLLLEELNSHCEELRNYTFAKHIVSKLGALTEDGG